MQDNRRITAQVLHDPEGHRYGTSDGGHGAQAASFRQEHRLGVGFVLGAQHKELHEVLTTHEAGPLTLLISWRSKARLPDWIPGPCPEVARLARVPLGAILATSNL